VSGDSSKARRDAQDRGRRHCECLERRRGHIGLPQASLYVATKHAVEGLTKAVALEFAKQGIRVNSVAPGTIATDMVDRMVGRAGDARNWLLSLHPVGRFGASEEIAAAVLYLASDAAKFTTGTTLLVDGGWTAQ
jgi:NAD(P)-dependent dehydrogenase (short-subunit alcohol dehydrogenase family)